MGATLSVNCGSSSLKAALYSLPDLKLLLEFNQPLLYTNESHGSSLKDAFEKLFTKLHKEGYPIIERVGHRFVHGGAHYRKPTLIDDIVLADLKALTELAPLHNRHCYEGIVLCKQRLVVPQTAVFDTGFFAEMPEVAKAYALPRQLVERYSIIRYGFHGISHEYLWNRVQEAAPYKKVITLHLGNGCSATATKEGTPLDTSMGFTPLEGLVMGTRCGDLDPSIVDFLCEKEGLTTAAVIDILNHQSGLLGLSGETNDMDTLLSSGEHRKTIDLFCYRIRKYIGAYQAVLGGAEAIVFSGGIGENSSKIRALIAEPLAWQGIALDQEANEKAVNPAPGDIAAIHSADASVDCYVIATDENKAIAAQIHTK